MSMPYLTIKQAAEATGKSEKTIRRLVNSPEAKDFVTREEGKPNGAVQIDSSYLQSVYPMSTTDEPTQKDNSPTGQSIDTGSQPVQAAQNNDLQAKLVSMLEEQLRLKDDQIKEKDKRIIDLTDKLTEIRLLTEGSVSNATLEEPEAPKKKKWWRF